MEALKKVNTSEYYNILITPSMDMFLPAMVTMLSAIKNGGRPCHFYIMQSDFSEENKEAYRKLIGNYPGNQIEFIDMNNEDFQKFNPWKGRYSAYYKLSAPENLPESVDRILYLDCDLYVKKDISEYYDMDFEDNFIIASTEQITQAAYERAIQNGLEKHGYLNTGVELFNLQSFHHAGISLDYYAAFINEFEGDYFVDQGLQCYVFDGKIKLLPSYKYNHLLFQVGNGKSPGTFKGLFSLSEAERKRIASKPYREEVYDPVHAETIVHFTGWHVAKPWMSVPKIASKGVTGIIEIPGIEVEGLNWADVEGFYLQWWQIASELPQEYFQRLLVFEGQEYHRVASRSDHKAIKDAQFHLSKARSAMNFCFELNMDFLGERKFERFMQSLAGKKIAVLKVQDRAGKIFPKACENVGAKVVFSSAKGSLSQCSDAEFVECKKADVVITCSVHGTKTHERDGVKCIDIWDILRDDSLTKDLPAVTAGDPSSETLAAIAHEARRAKEICENIEKMATGEEEEKA